MNVRLHRALDALTAERAKTVQDVEFALYPEGTPMAQQRKADQQEKEADQQQAKQQESELLATHYDPSTLEGTIGAFTQAVFRRDPAGMAKLMFVADAPDSTYPLASAKRLLAIGDFQQAVMDHIDSKNAGPVAIFGLEADAAFAPSLAWDQPREHGDVGAITRGGEGEVAAWYRKVGGVWKQEIKLQVHPPQTLADYTQDVEDDNATLQRITADINDGKLTSMQQVRDALGNAMLNCFGDPTFTVDFKNGNQNQPRPHDRPENAPTTTTFTTPAGAMNRFIRAVQGGDEATVCDCLWLPSDANHAAATAMAHDYVVGIQFVRALQKDSPGWDVDGFCQSAGTIPPESLRDYSEDEWKADPQNPDVAVSSGAYTRVPDFQKTNGQTTYTMKHQWTPIMHRGTDGVWRLGPWYAVSARRLQQQVVMLTQKDKILSQATSELNADKVRSIDDLSDTIFPKLKAIGIAPRSQQRP